MSYNTEAYIKQFTPEQRLEAYLRKMNYTFGETIRTGFALAQDDSWRMIAPAWLKEFEGDGLKPLEEFRIDEK